jgi:NADPH-dependent curcumin reductase CurA
MNVGKNRQWILHARPTGKLAGGEFRWNETSIPQPSDGQALVRNLWSSVDPAQRTWMTRDSYKPKRERSTSWLRFKAKPRW